MSNLVTMPLQDAYESELSTRITAAATSISVVDAPDFTLGVGESVYGVIDPESTNREGVQITAISGTTLTVVRGLAEYKGGPSTAQTHEGGAIIRISDNWQTFDDIDTAMTSKLDLTGGTLTGSIDFSGASTTFRIPNLTEAERDALAALNGMLIYNTTAGEFQYYDGGVWQSVGMASVPNASTTVAGIVEEATGAEVLAGTAAGGTGARLYINPSDTLINESVVFFNNTDITGAEAETLTDGSNADSLHTHSLKTLSAETITAGENIDGSTTPQAVCKAGANYKGALTVHNQGTDGEFDLQASDFEDLAFGDQDSFTRRAQSFTYTDADADTITLNSLTVWLEKVGTPTDNITIEIQGDDSNKPDKVTITNGTSDAFAGGGLTAGAAAKEPIKFTWSTPPTLTSGTKYWFVIKRSGSNNAGDYYKIAYENAASRYPSHGYNTYTGSTSTWGTAQVEDIMFHMEFNLDYGNEIYLLDADNMSKCNFIGFTESNISAGANVDIALPGTVQDSFTGLTDSNPYYASTTAGAITTTIPAAADNVQIMVGSTISTTKLLTQKVEKRFYKELGGIDVSELNTKTLELTIPCGFKPERIRLLYNYAGNPDGYVTDSLFVGTTLQAGLGVSDLNGAKIQTSPVTTIGVNGKPSTANDVVYPSEIGENYMKLTVKQSTGDVGFSNIHVFAEGH